MFSDIQDKAMERWLAIAMPDQRIFGLYLLSALILAFLSWLYYRRLEQKRRPEHVDRSFLAYLLDKDVFFHNSAKQDYIYFFVNGLIYVGILSQLLLGMHLFSGICYTLLESGFGVREAPLMASPPLTIAIYTVFSVLMLDLAVFLTHYAQHKIPLLWEFHKVHHSAEVLTPITLYRMHPVDLFFNGLLIAVFSGFSFGLFFYLTGETPQAHEIMGLNIFVFAFYIFGYNLRHSHIWLNYPKWLSHIVISPAQHQIHHSTAPKHFDRNMGIIFAFWDKIFGTLYVPESYEKISYGLNKQEPNPFGSVWDLYVMPFKKAWRLIYSGDKPLNHAMTFLAGLVFVMVVYAAFFSFDRQLAAQNAPLKSVHVEELTWTEIHHALDEGYDTIIIPTGGTEQNGPHMVLGKHNYVVRYTSEHIAKRLGHTLVAPVIAYVPEDIHMDWPGTISIPDEIFEGILSAAAESYIKHGFKNILFIGDSHGNQDGQDKVAQQLSQRHKKGGVIVAHIGDYYSANGQMDMLLARGHSKEQIGGHAGIRDTSEMEFVYPGGVRNAPRIIADMNAGYNGDPSLASKATGKLMLDLKIDAALKQIRDVLQKKTDGTGGKIKDEYNGVSFNVGLLDTGHLTRRK